MGGTHLRQGMQVSWLPAVELVKIWQIKVSQKRNKPDHMPDVKPFSAFSNLYFV